MTRESRLSLVEFILMKFINEKSSLYTFKIEVERREINERFNAITKVYWSEKYFHMKN